MVLLNKERVKKTFLDQRYDEEEILKWRDEKERWDGERPEHPQESFDKEVRLHRLAAEHGIAPKIYNVKPKKRSYELDRLDRTMLEYGLDKEKLEDSFQKKLISRCIQMDAIGLHHNDSNVRNVMLKGEDVFIIDFGRSKTFDWFDQKYKPPSQWTFDELQQTFTGLENTEQRKYLKKANEEIVISNLEAIDRILTAPSGLVPAYKNSRTTEFPRPEILIKKLVEVHELRGVIKAAFEKLETNHPQQILTKEEFTEIWKAEAEKNSAGNVSRLYWN